MLNYRSPWSNSYTLRMVAAVDMAFACLLVTIYVQKLLMSVAHVNNFNEAHRVSSSVKLLLLGPIIFNVFQTVMAFNLFSAGNKRCEPLVAYAKAHTWFKFSCIVFVFLFVKLFLILCFPPEGSLNRKYILVGTLIVTEIVFKVFGLFIVKEFIDDLKHVLSTFACPQYYCIYTTTTAPPFPALAITPNPPTAAASTSTTNLQTGPLPSSAPAYPFINNFSSPKGQSEVPFIQQPPPPPKITQVNPPIHSKRDSAIVTIV